MRVLIFHGYLLAGTGSNVYNARLAEVLGRLGHEVHLFCQDRHPERQSFLGAAGDWDSGELRVSVLGPSGADGSRADGSRVDGSRVDGSRVDGSRVDGSRVDGSRVDGSRADGSRADGSRADGSRVDGSRADGSPLCTAYRPDIGGLLPVYVLDPYEGIEAKTFAQCSEVEVAAYIRANVDAVREVTELVRPDVALANHLVMGPVILARALGGRTPYAVKIHGSALEYTVKPQPERFLPFAREGLAQARTVLVGSGHTAESLWAALDAECGAQVKRRTRLGPPGVDVERFVPRELRDIEAGETVAFVGKLIAAKGIDLLVAAWPLVLQRRPNARLLVVGFGSWREQVEDLCLTLGQGELERAEDIALPYLLAFLRGLDADERERYADAARRLADWVVFAGRLDHDELADVLPACEALVVPSTFPEAFGMVAVEGAACGVLPISAGHSGLAEVSAAIAAEIPSEAAAWLSFPVDENVVRAIAERVVQWLQADAALKERTRAALVAVARERWSWEGVGRGVIAAALVEPDPLERNPDAPAR